MSLVSEKVVINVLCPNCEEKNNCPDYKEAKKTGDYIEDCENFTEVEYCIKKTHTCPECKSDNVYKDGENFEGEYFECLDCGAEWKRLWDGTIF